MNEYGPLLTRAAPLGTVLSRPCAASSALVISPRDRLTDR